MGAAEGHGKGSGTELLLTNIILDFGSSDCDSNVEVTEELI